MVEDDEDEFYEVFSDPDVTYGMIWILVHWLLPAKASRSSAIDLIRQAYQEYETGADLGNRTDW